MSTKTKTYKGKIISFDLKDALEMVNIKESTPYIGIGCTPYDLNGRMVIPIACDKDTDEAFYVTVPLDKIKVETPEDLPLPSFDEIKDTAFIGMFFKDEGDYVSIKFDSKGNPLTDEMVEYTDEPEQEATICKNQYALLKNVNDLNLFVRIQIKP